MTRVFARIIERAMNQVQGVKRRVLFGVVRNDDGDGNGGAGVLRPQLLLGVVARALGVSKSELREGLVEGFDAVQLERRVFVVELVSGNEVRRALVTTVAGNVAGEAIGQGIRMLSNSKTNIIQ